MPEDLKPFRIIKQLNALNLNAGASPNDWNITALATSGFVNEGWSKISGNTFLQQQTIDLHGLTAQEKTMFFSTQFLQRPHQYETDAAFAASGGMTIWDQIVVSDVPLANPEVPVGNQLPSIFAGFDVSADDYITVKLAEGVILAQNNAIPLVLSIVDSFSFGSGDPTASNKLYLYRWATINTSLPIAIGGRVTIPPLRYVGLGVTTKEKELVWMQRLKRSFEIQNQSLV